MSSIKVKDLDTDSNGLSLCITLIGDDNSTEAGILMHLSVDLANTDEAVLGRVIDKLKSDKGSELDRLAIAGLEWFRENHSS